MGKYYDFKITDGEAEKVGQGWFGESRRHSEAALKGRGSSVAPIERTKRLPTTRNIFSVSDINKKNIKRATTFKIGETVYIAEFGDTSYAKGVVLAVDTQKTNIAGWKGNLTIQVIDNSHIWGPSSTINYYKNGTIHNVLSANVFHSTEEMTRVKKYHQKQ